MIAVILHYLKKSKMKKGLKVLGITLLVVIVGGATFSCKSQHELCPAYTNAEMNDSNKGV
jgi:hypothetical protein